jgi:hypothetical protein
VEHDEEGERAHRHRGLRHADEGTADDRREDRRDDGRDDDGRHERELGAAEHPREIRELGLLQHRRDRQQRGGVGPDAHEREVAERHDAAVPDEYLERAHEGDVQEEDDERACRRGGSTGLDRDRAGREQGRDHGDAGDRGPGAVRREEAGGHG